MFPLSAFSLCNHAPDADFEPAGEYIREIARKVLEKGLAAVDLPQCQLPRYQRVERGENSANRQKDSGPTSGENFAHRGDAHYYWLTGEFEESEKENEKSDHWALANGYVAVTPTTVDVTAYG